jgi:hypothetical protein
MNVHYSPPGNGKGRVSPGPIWAAVVLVALVVIAALAMLYRSRRSTAPIATRPGPAPQEMILAGPGARFLWRRDPRADVYRIEAYDQSQRLLAAAVVRDTSFEASVLLPDSARAGTWRVVAVTAGGTEIQSAPQAAFRRE